MRRIGELLAACTLGLLLLPIGVVVLAWGGWLPADALPQPPVWEAAIGQNALNASLAARARNLRNPGAAGDLGALFAGMRTFRNDCAGCHGAAGRDSVWGARNFYPRAPQFWRTDVRLTPEQAYVAIHDGVRYSGMGAWNGMLQERQVWEVANFVSRLHRLPPEVERAWFAKH